MPASDNDPKNKYLKEITFMPSTIETIDKAIYTSLDESWNLSTNTNKGWKKVPVIWVGAERAFQVKSDREIRDAEGMLKLPLITVERTGMEKDPSRRGIAPANIMPHHDHQGGSIVIARRIEQTETAKKVNAHSSRKKGTLAVQSIGAGQQNSRNIPRPKMASMFDAGPGYLQDRTVYETISIPMPAYVNVSYKIMIQTEYQQQMNELLTPFISRTGNARVFVCEAEGHRYEAFIENSYSLENNISTLEEEDRTFKSIVDIKVEGYLIGDGPNQTRPRIVKRQSALLAMADERTVLNGVEFPQKFLQTSAPSVINFVIQRVLNGSSGGGTTSSSSSSADAPEGAIDITDFIVASTVTGTLNASNKTFTLPSLPVTGTVTLFLNGVAQEAGEDYTISGRTITMVDPPESTDTLMANYIRA